MQEIPTLVALRPNGTFWVWGNNIYYQLGFGDIMMRKTRLMLKLIQIGLRLVVVTFIQLLLRQTQTVLEHFGMGRQYRGAIR